VIAVNVEADLQSAGQCERRNVEKEIGRLRIGLHIERVSGLHKLGG
jgi:hypothetical protein